MAMMSLTGATTQQDAAGALAILQVIADPAKAKARLDELVKAAEQAGNALEEGAQKLAVLRELETRLKADTAEIAKQTATLAADRAALKVERDALNQDKASHQKQAHERMAMSETFIRDRDTTTRELAKREQAVTAREQQAKESLESARAMEAEYAAKLKQLKSLAA